MVAPSHLPSPTARLAPQKPGASRQPTLHGDTGHRPQPAHQADVLVAADDQAPLDTMALPPRQEARLHRAMLDSIADAVTVVNRGGTILFHNRAARRVLGYGPDELTGSSIFELIHEKDLPQLYSAFFNVIEGFIEHASARIRHRARDGSFRSIEATADILRDVSFAGVVFTFRPTADPFRMDC